MIFVKISHNFNRSPLKFTLIRLISQISVHSLWEGVFIREMCVRKKLYIFLPIFNRVMTPDTYRTFIDIDNN